MQFQPCIRVVSFHHVHGRIYGVNLVKVHKGERMRKIRCPTRLVRLQTRDTNKAKQQRSGKNPRPVFHLSRPYVMMLMMYLYLPEKPLPDNRQGFGSIYRFRGTREILT